MKAWKGDVWDEQGQLKEATLRDAIEMEWYETIAETLKQFKAARVDAILVDVGNNSGGDDSGDISARLFTAVPLHSETLLMSQDTAASKAYFDEQFAALKKAASDQPNQVAKDLIGKAIASLTVQQEKLSSACTMNWVWQRQQDWESGGCKRLVNVGSAGGPLDYLKPDVVEDVRIARRLHWPAKFSQLWGTWTGPVYVLTNGSTYSSAEMFAAVLVNNKAAKTVGTQTGGDGCGFMNSPEPLTLPHSQLRFRIPNCVRLRADRTDEVGGVKPNLQVLPVEGESSRNRAFRMTHVIKADLKSTAIPSKM